MCVCVCVCECGILSVRIMQIMLRFTILDCLDEQCNSGRQRCKIWGEGVREHVPQNKLKEIRLCENAFCAF